MKKKKIFLLIVLFFSLTTFVDINQTKKKSFFSIDSVELSGIKNANESKIEKKIELIKGKNLFFLRKNDIVSLLENNKFIKKIEIKKIYPNKLKISFQESLPIGILIQENKNFLLLQNGLVIKKFDKNKFNYLPLVSGIKAEKNYFKFYSELKTINFNTDFVNKFYYYKVNRWDILLKDEKLIKLPSVNYINSIERFIEIYQKEEFKKFKIFDFRIEKKLILN